MKNTKGFTLIEVIIVVAIIGIMVVIAIPSISGWLPNYRLKGAARDLYLMMQKTRMEAVKRNRNTAIEFDVTNKKYSFCDNWDSTASPAACVGNSQVIDLSSVGSGVGYGQGNATSAVAASGFGNYVTYTLSSPPPDDVVIFNPRGLCNSGYVYLDNKDNTAYAVGSLTSGVIRILRWQGGSWK